MISKHFDLTVLFIVSIHVFLHILLYDSLTYIQMFQWYIVFTYHPMNHIHVHIQSPFDHLNLIIYFFFDPYNTKPK